MVGLAEQMTGQPMAAPQGGSGQGGGDIVMKVVELLKQGMTPEDLLQRGVPEEVIRAAMQVIAQEAGTQMPADGLAAMQTNAEV